jgi:hypothetical protein
MGVDHHHRFGPDCRSHHRVGDPQPVEHRKYVGAKLDAEAYDAKLRRLLEDLDWVSLPAKRQRCRGSPEPAAHDQNRIGLACH